MWQWFAMLLLIANQHLLMSLIKRLEHPLKPLKALRAAAAATSAAAAQRHSITTKKPRQREHQSTNQKATDTNAHLYD